METPRILVVDDEPAIRALVAKIVERAGFVVETARDGAEAIEKLREMPFEVVVVDLMMPNVDGYGVVEYIASLDTRPAVIVVTAGDSAAIRRLDGALVHTVLRKPFDIDVLADLIAAAARTMTNERDAAAHVIRFPDRANQ